MTEMLNVLLMGFCLCQHSPAGLCRGTCPGWPRRGWQPDRCKAGPLHVQRRSLGIKLYKSTFKIILF